MGRSAALLVAVALTVGARPASAAAADLLRHPARLAHLVKVAVARLVAEPEGFLELGFARPPGEPDGGRRSLRRAFAGATLLDVGLPGFEPAAAAEGRLAGLTVEVAGLRISPLVTDRAWLALDDVRFDVEALATTGRLRFLEVRGFRFRMGLDEAALGRLVPAGYRVRVVPGSLSVEGRVRLLLVTTFFRIEGDLQVVRDRRLEFRARRLNVANLPLVDLFREGATRRLNPLFDLDGYLGRASEIVQVKLAAVGCQAGRVEAEGGGRLALAGPTEEAVAPRSAAVTP